MEGWYYAPWQYELREQLSMTKARGTIRATRAARIPDPLTARGAVPSKKYTIILRFLLKCLPPRIFVWHKQNLISGSALAQRTVWSRTPPPKSPSIIN